MRAKINAAVIFVHTHTKEKALMPCDIELGKSSVHYIFITIMASHFNS